MSVNTPMTEDEALDMCNEVWDTVVGVFKEVVEDMRDGKFSPAEQRRAVIKALMTVNTAFDVLDNVSKENVPALRGVLDKARLYIP